MKPFEFTHRPIDPARLAQALAAPAAGGFATFEGRVRDHNDGRTVTALDYEAFEALACAEGERIVAEARRRHGVLAARCVHRLGALAVGDVAVWVGAAGAHRAEAFAACREIIDEVKHRLPIWKKEHYGSGDSGWVHCEACAAHAEGPPREAVSFDYSRQAALPEIGAAGQRRLADAAVLVVGAGGLGCPVLTGLAGAGVGTIGIVDDDRVDASNLHRQPLFSMADVGRLKADAASARLAAYNPTLRLRPYAMRFDAQNALDLLAGFDVVVDCSDNFATKFIINDAAMRSGKTAVIASVYQYEGQLQVVRPQAGSCLRCLWPEATPDGITGNCRQSGVLGPAPAVLGSLQAMEVLKLLLDLPGQLRDELLLVDLLDPGQRRLQAPRDPRCAGSCRFLAAPESARVAENPDVELPLAAAARDGYCIIDIREPSECADDPLPVAAQQALPLGQLLDDDRALAPGPRYLLVCTHGVRSRAAAEILRSRGRANVWSLRGGLAAHRG